MAHVVPSIHGNYIILLIEQEKKILLLSKGEYVNNNTSIHEIGLYVIITKQHYNLN
jgi:hypothetical protein